MKVAKLVTVTLITRVVVDEDATEEQIIEAAQPMFKIQASTELSEHIESIKDDTECPYDKNEELRDKLTTEEKKIFDAIMSSFPATDPESAYNKAIEGGVNFQFIYK